MIESASRDLTAGTSPPVALLQPKPRLFWPWVGLFVALICASAAAFSGLGYRWGWWHFGTGFTILKFSAICAAVGAVVCMVVVMFNLGRSGRAVLIAAAGLAIALITVLIPVQWKHTLDRLPRIHDITTDMDDPPSYVDALRLRTRTDHPLTYDGADVALKQRAAYPDVRPLFVKTSKSKTFETAKRVIRDLGLELAGASLEEGRLEAVDTSPLFGFKDDLVIRIRELSTGSRVDMRSKSRVGLSDLGQNAARIRRVTKALRTALGE